jgi:hypothetical protein
LATWNEVKKNGYVHKILELYSVQVVCAMKKQKHTSVQALMKMKWSEDNRYTYIGGIKMGLLNTVA